MNRIFLSVVLFFVTFNSALSRSDQKSFQVELPEHMQYPDVITNESIKDLVEGIGLIYESYNVTTKDGYILNLNRMVLPRLLHRKKGIPILMINGLNMNSETWLIQGKPTENLAVSWLLKGYDVWLGDQRGTVRSSAHVKYDTQDKKFWEFSFHESGVYDLPAFIDFILRKTERKKLVYVGLSLGSTFFFVMCSERPEYQDKLYGAFNLVPVGLTPEMSSQFVTVRTTFELMLAGMTKYRQLGIGNIRDVNTFRNEIRNWCFHTVDWWMLLLVLTLGPGGRFNRKDFCHQITLSIGGTSVKTFLHTLQLYYQGEFARYDYGYKGNRRVYGQDSPPTYNLTKVAIPTATYYSNIDIFAPDQSVEPMIDLFSGPTYRCKMQDFNHIGIIMDTRFKYILPDFVNVLDSMTNRNGLFKAFHSSTSCSRNVSLIG